MTWWVGPIKKDRPSFPTNKKKLKKRTLDGTDCPIIIIHIPQKKQGVTANITYPYVGLTYKNIVVTKNGQWYYFKIDIEMIICH